MMSDDVTWAARGALLDSVRYAIMETAPVVAATSAVETECAAWGGGARAVVTSGISHSLPGSSTGGVLCPNHTCGAATS